MNPLQNVEDDSNLETIHREQSNSSLPIPPPIIVNNTTSQEAVTNEEEYVMYLKFLSTSHESDVNAETLQHETNVSESYEDQVRKERLELVDQFISAYNNGDFTQFFSLLYENCDSSVRFKIPAMSIECCGVIPLLSFFLLLNEIYPDSLFENIEKRFATIKPSKLPSPDNRSIRSASSMSGYMDIAPPLIETVENIDKFTGTRVFDQPVFMVFRELLAENAFASPFLMISEIVAIITNKLYTQQRLRQQLDLYHQRLRDPSFEPAPAREERAFTFITETNLTFDLPSNRIVQWSYAILASQSA